MASNTPAQQDSDAGRPSVQSMVESLRSIDSVLSPDEDIVRLPLKDLLALLPRKYLTSDATSVDGVTVPVRIENLFYRLSRGKVAMPMEQLAASLPSDMLLPHAKADTTEICIPLNVLVGAIRPSIFLDRMASRVRRGDLSEFPDHFPELKHALARLQPQSEPHHNTPVPQPPSSVSVPASAPVRAQRPAEPSSLIPPAAPVPPVSASSPRRLESLDSADEGDYIELETLGGVNLNAATVAQLVTLDGVTAGMAGAIVAYRQTHGPLVSIFDLVNVPRLGRGTFRRITGMPYSETRRHRRRKLARLLRLPPREVGDLKKVAGAICGLSGVAGCLVSDADGMLMAESGATSYAAPMSAVIPRMFRLIYENMAVASVGKLDSVSLCVRDRLYTIVAGERFCLTVVHQTSRLTKTQITTIQKLAGELDWLLSHRGYIGRATT